MPFEEMGGEGVGGASSVLREKRQGRGLPQLLPFLLDKVGSRFAEVESLLSLATVLR